jgi:hypothetical protein
MTVRLAIATRTAKAAAAVGLLDAGAGPGTIKVYTGTQPATPATAPTGTHLLTFTLNDPAYSVADPGLATLDVDPAVAATGLDAGEAGWFRAADSAGNAILDGVCGTSGQQLNLNTTTVSVGLTVTVTSGTYSQPM